MDEWDVAAAELSTGAARETIATLIAERDALRRSNRMLAERIDGLMNVHHAAILIIDPQSGEILDANAAAVRRYASGRAALLTKNIREINTLQPYEIAQRMRLAVAARRNHFEFQHRLHNGTVQDVDVYSGPILYDGRLALISFIHDATRRKSLERKLKIMASTDALTGCCNRRRFLVLLRQEFRRAQRHGAPLSVAMIDLDHFKRINDTWGHSAGDAVLKAIASTCRGMMRECDCFGRLGGEEFGVLLPGTDLGAAEAVLARIAAAARAMTVRVPEGELHATMSAGVSSAHAGDGDEIPMLHRADAALYLAKTRGRDRVETVSE